MLGRFTRDRSGTTAVEFALVVWPLVIMMIGTVEVARVLWVQQALNKTAISAARCVGIRSGNCARDGIYDQDLAVAYVTKEMRGWGLGISSNDIAILDGASCEGQAGFSNVVLTKQLFSPVPFVSSALFGSGDQMTASACFPTQGSTP